MLQRHTVFSVSDAAAEHDRLQRDIAHEAANADGVVVFDFDGVLASPVEDAVYQAIPLEGDRRIYDELADRFGIDQKLYDDAYLRHLVYQELLLRTQTPIESGPFLDFAKDLSRQGRAFYVLTARSSLAAVRRALDFITSSQLNPQEIFFVGRVGKGRQLNLLLGNNDAKRIIYVEDSRRHVRNSIRLSSTDIRTVHVMWDRSELGDIGRVEFDRALQSFLRQEGNANDQARAQFSQAI